MGSIIGASAALEVRGILGAVDTSMLSDTFLYQDLNAAYREDICARADLSELDTVDAKRTTANQAMLTFDAPSVLTIKGITDSNGIPLKEITANEYDRVLNRTGVLKGLPRYWYKTSNKYIYATPLTVSFSGGGGTGATATAVTAGGVVTSTTLVSGGQDYTSAPSVTFAGGAGNGVTPTQATASASVVMTDTVTDVIVTSGGEDYATATGVTIAPPVSGTTATATAVIEKGHLDSVTLDVAGTGYTSAPNCAVSGGGGSGAHVSAVLVGTEVDTVTGFTFGDTPNAGFWTSSFESAPTVTVYGGGGTLAAVTLDAGDGNTGYLFSITITDRGSGYVTAPTIQFTGDGSGAAAECEVWGGKISRVTLTNPGSGYTVAPTVAFIPTSGGINAAADAALGGLTSRYKIASAAVEDGGEGYTSPPVLKNDYDLTEYYPLETQVITAPTVCTWGTSNMVALNTVPNITVTLVATEIDHFTVTAAGSGYSTVPDLAVTGGGGASGAGTCVLAGRAVSDVIVTNGGSGYVSVPAVTFDAGAATATAVITHTGYVSQVNLLTGGSGYSDIRSDTTPTPDKVNVLLYPVPTTAYLFHLNYRRLPDTITSSTYTEIASAYDQAWIYYTASRTAARLRMFDDSIKLKQLADSYFASALGARTRTSEYIWSFRTDIQNDMT